MTCVNLHGGRASSRGKLNYIHNMTSRDIVLTSSTYSEATNSTRIVYAEEDSAGNRDAWKEHTIYHDSEATEQERNSEVDAFIEKQTTQAL